MLSARLRRLTTCLYVQELWTGTRVAVLSANGPAPAEDEVVRFLAQRGATVVSESCDLVLALDLEPSSFAPTLARAKALLNGGGALVLAVRSADCPSTPKGAGLSYYELVDQIEPAFGKVKMVGQASFAGSTLAEYGVADPEPILDGSLVDKGERVEWYVAVAGEKRDSIGGYGVIQVPVVDVLAPPVSEVKVLAPVVAAKVAPVPEVKVAPVPEVKVVAPVPVAKVVAPAANAQDLSAELAAAQKSIDEFKSAALLHARAMAEREVELAERDAYIAELQNENRRVAEFAKSASEAYALARATEEKEREARRLLAVAEGRLLRPPELEGATRDLQGKLAALEAENEKLRLKEADARADSWKNMKARSDAEAAAAEVREDTVRKLKDARKLASVELMRAMEEATKKAVTLREELTRSERERKDAIGQVSALRAEVAELSEALKAQSEASASLRDLARAREEGDAAVKAARAYAERDSRDEESARHELNRAREQAEARSDSLYGKVVVLERELEDARRATHEESERSAELGRYVRKLESDAGELERKLATGAAEDRVQLEIAEAEKERFARLLADVEREAKERSERALRMRQTLREREREVEALRREIRDRDAKLNALEKRLPPREEVQRIEAQFGQARTRLLELSLELTGKDAEVERARAAAAHERTRAERMAQEERMAIAERNQLRTRVAESEAQLEVLVREKQVLTSAIDRERERAKKSENESAERKERIQKLKREMDSVERKANRAAARAESVAAAQQKIASMQGLLATEAERMALIEESLRRAAAESRANGQGGE